MKTYQQPTVEIVLISKTDILSDSPFNGDDQIFS